MRSNESMQRATQKPMQNKSTLEKLLGSVVSILYDFGTLLDVTFVNKC